MQPLFSKICDYFQAGYLAKARGDLVWGRTAQFRNSVPQRLRVYPWEDTNLNSVVGLIPYHHWVIRDPFRARDPGSRRSDLVIRQ